VQLLLSRVLYREQIPYVTAVVIKKRRVAERNIDNDESSASRGIIENVKIDSV